VSVREIDRDDLPPKIRAKLGLPPVPPKRDRPADKDFYEHARYLEQKKSRPKKQAIPLPFSPPQSSN